MLEHVNFTRYHPDLKSDFEVEGSFLTRVYVLAKTNQDTIRVAYEPGESFRTGCSIELRTGNGLTNSTVKLEPYGRTAWDHSGIQLRFDVHKPKLLISTPEWTLVFRAAAIRGSKTPKKRLDLSISSVKSDPSKGAVAPHGLLGQAWDGDDQAVNGMTDGATFAKAMTHMKETGKVETVKTSSNAEGAIEGVASDYVVSRPSGDPFSAQFKFSRFGLLHAKPRDAAALSGRKQKAGQRDAGANGFLASIV